MLRHLACVAPAAIEKARGVESAISLWFVFLFWARFAPECLLVVAGKTKTAIANYAPENGGI